MNMYNFNSYALENPLSKRKKRSQYHFKVNMWTDIIGFFELYKNLNGEIYYDFLQNELPNLLQNLLLVTRRALLF